MPGRQRDESRLSRQETTHSPDGILDAAFLPGGMRVAEVGPHGQPVQLLMAGEFGAVVESDGLAQVARHGLEQADEALGHAIGSLAREPAPEDQPRAAFVHGEHGLAVSGEEHEVAFPMADGLAVCRFEGAFSNGNTAFDEACRAPAPSASVAALALAVRQIATPAIVLSARDLGVDEAVDALVADHQVAGFARKPAGHLLRRPALGQALKHGTPQARLAFEARTHPAPRLRLFLRITRFIADIAAAIAPQLPSDRRWRAIQICSNLPDRTTFGLKAGNLAPLLQ